MAKSYEAFLATKTIATLPTGFEPGDLAPHLFPYQADIVRWALRRGRAAIFAGTGLGKTAMMLEWATHVARHTGKPVLILAPLAVSRQTAKEAERFGVPCAVVAEQSEVTGPIVVTNYEKLHKFDPSAFAGVVLDESSCLKAYDGKTKKALVDGFAQTPYRLSRTATPAPNDHEELGNQAEFLGVLSRREMLATFFVHDGGDTSTWRLKGHAVDKFWEWICSWAVVIRQPSDLGYDDGAHQLPPLTIHTHVLETDAAKARATGSLFVLPARTLNEQRAAKRDSLALRVAQIAALIAAESAEQWVVWCELNDEQDALEKALGAEAVSIRGADSPEEKVRRHELWITGEKRVLISKSILFGFGLNWQHCARMAFAGVTHSYEQFYQSIRRCWRFGQRRPVDIHIVLGDAETDILANIQRKEADAKKMIDGVAVAMGETQRANVRGQVRETDAYEARHVMKVPNWLQSEVA